jgi:hypothetical protein
MLAEQAAQGTSGGSGFQTMALVPDGESGQYVLIVQQPQQDQDGNNTPSASTSATTPSASTRNASKRTMPQRQTRMTRIKKEKQEPVVEKTNDISVYDFDEVNQPRHEDGEESGQVDDDGMGEEDVRDGEEDGVDDDEDVKPNMTSATPKKPKVKRAKKMKASPAAGSTSSNQHMCNYCNYTSSKRYLLSRHMKSHSEERPHKCGICERGFKVSHVVQF